MQYFYFVNLKNSIFWNFEFSPSVSMNLFQLIETMNFDTIRYLDDRDRLKNEFSALIKQFSERRCSNPHVFNAKLFQSKWPSV
jgi:hypothetical protein